jgi:hypothetical protein
MNPGSRVPTRNLHHVHHLDIFLSNVISYKIKRNIPRNILPSKFYLLKLVANRRRAADMV